MHRRRVAGVVGLLVALACTTAAVSATGSVAAKTAVTPCMAIRNPVSSPDGTQIAYYGTRWPPPPHMAVANRQLQAFCVADANGKNAQPLRYTVCDHKCQDFPYQISWMSPNELLYVADGPVYSIAPGSKPKKTGVRINAPSFTLDAAGDRLASGANFPGCVTCSGPVTVFDLSSGKLVGNVGGKKYDNMFPSLSPDGKRVVFERDATTDSGRTYGIWIANANGSRVRRLESVGFQPLWSPAGNEIAYVAPFGKGASSSLRLVSPSGGKVRTLVARGVENSGVYSWSPDGKQIAIEVGSRTFGKLAVVNVATGKVRKLLGLYYSPTVSWAPDSKSLLADSWPIPQPKGCSALYRVPVSGGKPTLLRHC